MNVALICNEYPPQSHGGIGTFVHMFAHGLVRAGHRAIVVGVGDAAGERNDIGVRVVTLRRHRIRKVGWLLDRLAIRSFIQQQIRQAGLDIVEVPDFEGMLPFGVRGVPCVVRLHCSTTTLARCAGTRLRQRTKWCERRTLRMCGNWIAVSKHAFGLTKDSFPGLSPNRSSLVYNPIRTGTPSQCAPFEATQAFVLHAGYVSVSKGAVLLAEAAKQFLKEFPHVHLVYAGTVLGENGKKPGDEGAGRGVDELILETLDSELAKRCHFTGFIEHSRLLGLMRRARVFVFPSSLETFGLVVTEAMLQGCPVVVPDTGPFNEYVVHEQTGLLAEISSPTAFAECVIRMLRDPVLRQRLSVAGQQMVRDQFTLERNIEKSLAFYEECIRNKNGAIVKLASNAESLGTVFARNKE